MSRMHSIDVTEYITDEAKKFAEVLSDRFWGVDVKIKESYSSTKIHFNLHWSGGAINGIHKKRIHPRRKSRL